jgi:ABC-type molybdenum transport system ATPase subunit/photorepair protein PhrA
MKGKTKEIPKQTKLDEEVNGMDFNQMCEYVTVVEKSFLTHRGDTNVMGIALRFFVRDMSNISLLNIDMDPITHKYKSVLKSLNTMYHRSGELGVRASPTRDINGEDVLFGKRLTRIRQIIGDAYETINSSVRQSDRINNPTYVPSEADDSIHRTKVIDEEDENSPLQKALLYLLDQLYKNRYRRYGECCYRQIKTPEGHLTCAWEQVCEIKDFVYQMCQKEDKYDMWKAITSRGGVVNDVVKHLTNCTDVQFPDIKKDRHVWSFRNGIFVGKVLEDEKYVAKFYNYGDPEIDPDMVAAKYFDEHFVDYKDPWNSIPTPNFQIMLDFQNIEEEVGNWLFVFIGRLCFEVNEMDKWQVIPFIKGVAYSGKSTIINQVCKLFYEGSDVKVLSNNIEKKFGLDSINGGLMFVSPEIKGDLQLEQAEFQSMVSGESMSIARKNKSALSLQWLTPGILGGNEIPNWKDNSGSIMRRIVCWSFLKAVTAVDENLDNNLHEEIPTILCKSVRAYLDYSQKYGRRGIWEVLPSYFKVIQMQVALATNSLHNFLESEQVRFGKELYVPKRLFVSAFNRHCTDNFLGNSKFHPDFFAGPFSRRNLEVRTFTGTYNGVEYTAKPFIFGCDLVQEDRD